MATTNIQSHSQIQTNHWADQTTPQLRHPNLPQIPNDHPLIPEAFRLYNAGSYFESIQKLDQVITENPNIIGAYHYRGLACFRQAEMQPILTKQELRTKSTCCGLSSRKITVTVQDQVATLALKADFLRKSITDLENAFQNTNSENKQLKSSIALSLAIGYHVSQDEGGKRAYITRAVELNPDNMEARKAKELQDKPNFYTDVRVTTKTTAIATANADARAKASIN